MREQMEAKDQGDKFVMWIPLVPHQAAKGVELSLMRGEIQPLYTYMLLGTQGENRDLS